MTAWRPLFEHQAGLNEIFSPDSLVTALSLSNEALCGCNTQGDILVANKNFSKLTGLSMQKALNSNLRHLLFSEKGKSLSKKKLPFETDGTSHAFMLRLPHEAKTLPVFLKALPLGEGENNFLVLLSPKDSRIAGDAAGSSQAFEGDVQDLVVLSQTTETKEDDELTPGSFSGDSRVLNELIKAVGTGDPSGIYSVLSTELMESTEADGAAVYVADREGYRLKAAKGTLQEAHLHKYRPMEDPLATLPEKEGATVRFNLCEGESTGEMKTFEALFSSEKPSEKVSVEVAPPFKSFYIVPVIFDGTIVAFTLVGWTEKTTLSAQSARILDLLSAHYADELVTASISMQSSISETIHESGKAIWTSMETKNERLIELDIQRLFLTYAKALSAQYMAFYLNEETRTRTAVVNGKTFLPITFKLSDIYEEALKNESDQFWGAGKRNKNASGNGENKSPNADESASGPSSATGDAPSADEPPKELDQQSQEAIKAMLIAFEGPLEDVQVFSFSADSFISKWTGTIFEKPLAGAIFVIPKILEKRHVVAIGRPVDEEPLSHIELTLYKRFLQDATLFVREKNQAAQDIYISKMLQAGLQNQTQKVEGLTAVPLYNSATKAAGIGGDFYDVIALPDHRACIIIGDVAGKGVGSAAISSAVRTALGAYAWEGLLPAHMVRSLNDFFLGFSRLETFATLFVGILDMKTGKFLYCSAGHPPSIVLHPKTERIELLEKQSGVVGAFREIIYEEGKTRLQPGDEIFLYTDGVTEAKKPSTGEFFGELSLHDVLLKNIHTPVEELPETLLQHLFLFSENSLDDDVAMMALRFDHYV